MSALRSMPLLAVALGNLVFWLLLGTPVAVFRPSFAAGLGVPRLA